QSSGRDAGAAVSERGTTLQVVPLSPRPRVFAVFAAASWYQLRLHLPVSSCNFVEPRSLHPCAGPEKVDKCLRQRRPIDCGAAPVGSSAGGVGEAVLAREFPRAAQVSAALDDVRIGCERGDRTADEQR